MKKMIHIAAVPSLAVLLSACAGPGTQPGTLDDLGPGGLAAVKEAVSEALLDDSGPGGLNPVQQAVQDTLNNPGPNDTPSMLQQAVQNALLDMGGKKEDFVWEEIFTFRWDGADSGIQDRIHNKLMEIFSVAQKDGSSGFKIKASMFTTNPDGSLFPIHPDGTRIHRDRGEIHRIYTVKDFKEMPEPGEVRSYQAVVYTAENLAGMTRIDQAAIGEVRDAISKIPGMGGNRIETPIRMDSGPVRVIIPKSNTQTYVLATGSGVRYPSCKGETTYRVVGDRDSADRDVTLFIYADGATPPVRKVEGPEYTDLKRGGVLVRTGEGNAVLYELVRRHPEHIVDRRTEDDGTLEKLRKPEELKARGWKVDGENPEWLRRQLGGKEIEESLKALKMEVGNCVIDKPETDNNFVLAALTASAPDPRPTVAHYYIVDLVSADVTQSYEYTEERPACPPSGGVWRDNPQSQSQLFLALVDIVGKKEGSDAAATLKKACPL